MSKFNKAGLMTARRPLAATSPVVTAQVADTVTHQGAPGFSRDAKSELYLLGLSHFTGEASFYETADARDGRLTRLVNEVAVNDPLWLAGYLPWLRTIGCMRSVPLTAGVDALRAMVAAGIPGSVALMDSVLRRPDAPGEALAYHAATYGRAFPIPLKKAVARAATRMYTQRMTVKYDTPSHAFRFGDVIELCRPRPRDDEQARLFKVCLDRAHKRTDPRLGGLSMLAADTALRIVAQQNPAELLVPGRLATAGWDFRDALPYAGEGSPVSKKDMWEAVIPTMGYEALLGNLAGFDRAGVSDEVAEQVTARIADPQQVRRAQVFPFRMLAAYEQVPSLRWGFPLEKAMRACLSNLPQLPGRSLVLVDTSASMRNFRLSAKSVMSVAKAAAVFGVALAAGQPSAQLYGFATGVFPHEVGPGASVLKSIQDFLGFTGRVGHGTDITGALQRTYNGHDRVFIITDEQSCTGYDMSLVPRHVPLYVFNLGGHSAAYARSGTNVHSMGGLTDATFTMVQTLEQGRSVTWPWEATDA